MKRDCSLNSLKNTSSEHVVYANIVLNVKKETNNFFTHHVMNMHFWENSMNIILSYCGLSDAKMRASEKDLPVLAYFVIRVLGNPGQLSLTASRQCFTPISVAIESGYLNCKIFPSRRTRPPYKKVGN